MNTEQGHLLTGGKGHQVARGMGYTVDLIKSVR